MERPRTIVRVDVLRQGERCAVVTIAHDGDAGEQVAVPPATRPPETVDPLLHRSGVRIVVLAPDAVRSDEPEIPTGVIQPLDVDLLLRVGEIDVVSQLERPVMAVRATFRRRETFERRAFVGAEPDVLADLDDRAQLAAVDGSVLGVGEVERNGAWFCLHRRSRTLPATMEEVHQRTEPYTHECGHAHSTTIGHHSR